jgi:hypothetical protein
MLDTSFVCFYSICKEKTIKALISREIQAFTASKEKLMGILRAYWRK